MINLFFWLILNFDSLKKQQQKLPHSVRPYVLKHDIGNKIQNNWSSRIEPYWESEKIELFKKSKWRSFLNRFFFWPYLVCSSNCRTLKLNKDFFSHFNSARYQIDLSAMENWEVFFFFFLKHDLRRKRDIRTVTKAASPTRERSEWKLIRIRTAFRHRFKTDIQTQTNRNFFNIYTTTTLCWTTSQSQGNNDLQGSDILKNLNTTP